MPIAEDQLIKILCDIHFAESAFDALNDNTKDTTAVRLYNQVYDIHQVQSADVDSCLAFLKRNPRLAEKVYTKVVEELEKMMSENE